jgi:hypothetical protein
MMVQSKRWLPALDDRPGPAPATSDARARAMVEGALDQVLGPALVSVGARPRRRFTRLAFAMAATLAVAGVAAAAFIVDHRKTPPPPPAAPTQVAPAESIPLGPSVLLPLSPSPSASAPTTPAIEAPVHQNASPSPPPPPRATRAPSGDSADLLARANELRAARRWKDAAQAYEKVLSVHPSSPEAYAAQVAAADLHLDQLHDPRGALRLYRGVHGGPLAEQVLWGIARSTRALGDANGEVTALKDYLARYPAGLSAAAARSRLTELGAPL